MKARALILGALTLALAPRAAVALLDRPYHDEPVYALIGAAWLGGSPPYLGLWDVKPPGLFALYAVAQALGASALVCLWLLPMIAAGASALGLYAIARAWFDAPRAGAYAAGLFGAFSLAAEGMRGPAVLLAAPFLIWSMRFALAPRRRDACAAGSLAACACLVLQSSAFEAVLACALTSLSGADGRTKASRAGGFFLGAAAPALAMAAILFAQGALVPAFEAVASVALARATFHPVGFWEGLALYLPWRLAPYLPLVALCGFALLRGSLAREGGAQAAMMWLVAALAGAIVQRAVHAPYVMPLLPPLCLLAGLWLARTEATAHRRALACLSVCYALAFSSHELLMGYYTRLIRETAQTIDARAQTPGVGKGLHVVDFEPSLHVLTGLPPATRFVFALHLNCPFPLPRGVDRMTEIAAAMARAPRFVVIRAEEPYRGVCMEPQVRAFYAERLKESYELLRVVGRDNEVRVYELRQGMAPRLRSR